MTLEQAVDAFGFGIEYQVNDLAQATLDDARVEKMNMSESALASIAISLKRIADALEKGNEQTPFYHRPVGDPSGLAPDASGSR